MSLYARYINTCRLIDLRVIISNNGNWNTISEYKDNHSVINDDTDFLVTTIELLCNLNWTWILTFPVINFKSFSI